MMEDIREGRRGGRGGGGEGEVDINNSQADPIDEGEDGTRLGVSQEGTYDDGWEGYSQSYGQGEVLPCAISAEVKLLQMNIFI